MQYSTQKLSKLLLVGLLLVSSNAYSLKNDTEQPLNVVSKEQVADFNSNDIQNLLAEKISMVLYNKQDPVTYDSTLDQIAKKSFIGGKIVETMKNIAFKGQDLNDLTTKSFMSGFDNQTFRSIVLGSSGRLNRKIGDQILKIANSELFDAIKEVKPLLDEFKKY